MQLMESVSKKEVLMMSFEEKMKKELKKNLEIPDVVEQKIQDAYKEIRQGGVTMKKLNNGNQKKRKAWIAAAAAVAVIAVSGSVFYANPVLAKNIPVIRDVFATRRIIHTGIRTRQHMEKLQIIQKVCRIRDQKQKAMA